MGFGYLPEALGLKCLGSVYIWVFGWSPEYNSVGSDRFEE